MYVDVLNVVLVYAHVKNRTIVPLMHIRLSPPKIFQKGCLGITGTNFFQARCSAPSLPDVHPTMSKQRKSVTQIYT